MTAGPDDSFYDAGWSNQWQDLKRYSPMGRHTRRWIARLVKQAPRPRSIADIGCGEGSLLAEITPSVPSASVFGCDFSAVSVELCQKRMPGGKFVVHDIREEKNPFGEVVDLAVCSEVIEHVDDDEKAVHNMASWTRHLVLTVPGGVLDDDARAMGHLRHYSKESLSRIVERAGMEILECREWGFPLAYPWYARLRNRAGTGVATGEYSLKKRLLTHALYAAFFANDFFDSGNKLFLLARAPRA